MFQQMNGKPWRWLACLTLALPACSGVHSGDALNRTSAFSEERLGHPIATAPDSAAISALLSKPLTADRALQIALLSNRRIHSKLEEIGISEAELMEAATPRNPTLSASWRWTSNGGRSDPDFGLMGDFLDWVLLPTRRKVWEHNVAATRQKTCAELLEFAAEVKTAFYDLQGRQQVLAGLRDEASAGDAMAELSKRMHDAGNIPSLEMHVQEASAATGRYQVAKAEAEVVESRAALNKLLGLSGADLSPARAEALAVSRRPDLEVAREHLSATEEMLKLKQKSRLIPGLSLGVDTEHDPEIGQLTGPSAEIEIPLFNWGRASVKKLQAEVRQAKAELDAAETNVRNEARLAAAQARAARELWHAASQGLLPQRREILKETLHQYNAMQKSNFELLQAKAEEQRASQEAVLALRDYWKAHVALEKAVGGRFSVKAPSSFRATKPGPKSHKHEHEHLH
jgi:cobalt-zinc-cadmium efflux system outer membrane protein